VRDLWPLTLVIVASIGLLLAMVFREAKHGVVGAVTRTTAVACILALVGAAASEWFMGIELAGCC
jgi:hypothetical protein